MSNLTAASTISHISNIALAGSLDLRRSNVERQALGTASDTIWAQAQDRLVTAIRAGEFEGFPDKLTMDTIVGQQDRDRAHIIYL